MEPQRANSRTLDLATALTAIAAFIVISLVLGPVPQTISSDDPLTGQLAFDDAPEARTPDPVRSEDSDPTSFGEDPTTDAPASDADGVPSEAESLGSDPAGGSNEPVQDDPVELQESASLQPDAGPQPDPASPRAGGTSEYQWAFNWGSDPGVMGKIGDWRGTTAVDSTAFGVVADDANDDAAAINAALSSLGDDGGIVILPPGSVLTAETIKLGTGQVLAGSGAQETRIIFTADNTWGIEMGGSYPRDGGKVVQGNAGDLSLNLRAVQPPTAGQHAVVTGGPADSAEAGQVVEVTAVSGSGSEWNVTLRDPLAQDLTGAAFKPFDAGQGIGLENLTLTVAEGVQVDYNIVLRHSANSWVTGVRSDWATRSHIYTRQTSRCEVRENTLVEATNKGDGGHGYGLNIANNTTGCLFMQNRLSRLRHSMLLHGGATANVVAYNTSTEPRHPNFVNGGPADMSFHGYAVANLVEGNIVERMQLTDAGSAGPNNAIVRNCFTSGPPTLKNGPEAALLIGNTVLGTNDTLRQRVMPAVEWSGPRPYTKSSLFDDDGVLVQGDAPGLVLDGNWFGGSVSGSATPPRSAFSTAERVPETPSGSYRSDCPYAP
ncbi:MAG: glycosyl hydrolase family 28-related protein [Acidimicrobiales bacterium]